MLCKKSGQRDAVLPQRAERWNAAAQLAAAQNEYLSMVYLAIRVRLAGPVKANTKQFVRSVESRLANRAESP